MATTRPAPVPDKVFDDDDVASGPKTGGMDDFGTDKDDTSDDEPRPPAPIKPPAPISPPAETG